MSILEARGGIPRIIERDVDTTGFFWDFKGTLKHLYIETDSTPVKIYFSEEDFTADTNYLSVNEWQGPVELRGIWLKGDGATSTVKMVPYYRRG